MIIKRAEKKPREYLRIQEQSLKVKSYTIKQAGIAGAKSASEQVEGGKELQNAALVEYMMAKPVVDATTKTTRFLKKKSHEKKNKRDKDKEKTASREEKENRRQEHKKENSKGKEGKTTADKKGDGKTKQAKKKQGVKKLIRQMQVALLQKKENSREQDGQATGLETFLNQTIGVKTILFSSVGLAIILLASIAVFLVVAMIYNSPYAILFPPLEEGDTVQSITSAYVAEFHQEVSDLASIHAGYDEGKIVFVDYEGATASPDNYHDILAVYMVKHGMGDTATMINDTTKGWIKDVVDDMCSYTTDSGTEEIQNPDGTTAAKQVLYVNVSLKFYQDMMVIYGFDENQENVLRDLMTSEAFLPNVSGDHKSKLSQEEIRNILNDITDETQRAACSFALSKVGYPYSQAYRDSGNYFDCSSLVFYAWKEAGVNISHNGSNTAASEARGLEEAGKIVAFEEMQPGDLIFWSYCSNGRYKNISHVGMYVGNGKVVEAYSESVGVIYGDVTGKNNIVTICRP